MTPGYCEPITDLYESEGWTDVMPAGLVEQATWESEQYSIPVGVHRGNGFWYNKQVMADNGIEVGDTMSVDEFFAAADTLKAAGDPALASGDEGHLPGSADLREHRSSVPSDRIPTTALFRGELPGMTRASRRPPRPMPRCWSTSTRTSRR